MLQPYHILADKGDLIQVIQVVIVLLIIGAGAIGKKIAARARQKQLRQGGPQRASTGEARQKAASPAPRPPAPPSLRRVPPRPDEALARAFRQQVGMSRQELPLRPPVEPEVHAIQEVLSEGLGAGAVGQGVEMETERQRRRLDMENLRRQDRLAARTPEEADTKSIESRLLHIPKAEQPPSAQAAAQLPSAQAPAQLPFAQAAAQIPPAIQQLRQAVIWYEILSPPKALRRGREPWAV